MILELLWKQRESDSFSLRRKKIHTLHVKSMRESKSNERLLLIGMSMKIQTKIQNGECSMESSDVSTYV